MAYALALPAGSRILDVGCGSGWLCEYFARLGYQVTGIDVSPELIRIANERVQKLPFGLDEKSAVSCEFLLHDIEHAPLEENFDAITLYDSLHHFEDEHAVLENIGQMLDYGGVLFVAEGEMPPEGSPTESELREVMEEFETLEAPFTREYLHAVLQQHGFAIAGDFTAVTGFVDRDNLEGNGVNFVETPSFNYLLCKKTDPKQMRDSRAPGKLRADLALTSKWTKSISPDGKIEFDISAKNVGDTLWLVSNAPLRGRVRLGVKMLNGAGEVIEEIHGWPRLQRAMAPDEKTELRVSLNAPTKPGEYSLKVDLVDQDICWFEENGSTPLLLSFEVKN
jgi:SAM-dependent methyltransferase